MQLNDRVTVTADRVFCRECGEWSAQDLLEGRSQTCRHATREEVLSLLEVLGHLHRRRHRPDKRVLREIESQHLNGVYKLHLLTDGSPSCQCLNFLFNRELQDLELAPGRRAATCKHIRQALAEGTIAREFVGGSFKPVRPPSPWQRIFLRAFGIEPHAALTNDQTYVVIEELLAKQGVEYGEVESLIRRHGLFTTLPIYAFGLEFEGFGCDAGELARSLTDQGLRTEVQGYNHTDQAVFKIVSDASIRGERPFELVTPKLFGADGFDKVRTLCRTALRLGAQVNSTTGLHVHVDAWNFTLAELKRLIAVWRKIEVPVVHWLLPPSRRLNSYAKPVDDVFVRSIQRMRSFDALGNLDRYYSLNLASYGRHGTFEFRAHSGTFNAAKVTGWVVFVLMLSGAVKAGLRAEDINPTWDGVSEAIGLTTGTSVIRRAWRFLSERNRLFRSGAAVEVA